MGNFCGGSGGGGGGGGGAGFKIRADANPYIKTKVTLVSGSGVTLTEDVANKEITISAAGSSVNKVTWAQGQEYYSDGSTETVEPELQWLINFDDAGGANVQMRLSAFLKVTAGTGTVRVRVGGTRDTADGTVVATITSVSLTYDPQTNLGAGFVNPGGAQLVKVTISNSGSNRSYVQGASLAVG